MGLMKFRFYTYLLTPLFLIENSNAYVFAPNSKNGNNNDIETYAFEPTSCGTSDYHYFKLKLQISDEGDKDLACYELVDIETKLKVKGFKVLQVDYLKFEILVFSDDPQNAFNFLKSNFAESEAAAIECFESAQL